MQGMSGTAAAAAAAAAAGGLVLMLPGSVLAPFILDICTYHLGRMEAQRCAVLQEATCEHAPHHSDKGCYSQH
jgi:hypothetical protein